VLRATDELRGILEFEPPNGAVIGVLEREMERLQPPG
jgi:hypothetical protein